MNNILSFKSFKFFIFFTLLVSLSSFSYSQSNVEAIIIDTLPGTQKEKTVLPKFRIGAQIGYGYRMASIPEETPQEMKSHTKKLKNNLSFGADMSYYFKKIFGIGVKYNGIYASSLSTDIRYMFPDGTVYQGVLSEKIGIHYVGGFLSTRFFPNSNNKHCVFLNAGAGYVRFSEKMVVIDLPAKITGNTAAFCAEIGYDFFVTKHLAIGLQISMMLGSLGAIDLTVGKITERIELDKSQREGLSHIDISLGFRFYK
jgi:hypothetical protein